MVKKFEAPAKLYLLVAVLSAFITGLSVYALFQMNGMDQNTRTLFDDRVQPLAQLGEIRFSYSAILDEIQQSSSHRITPEQAVKDIKRSEDRIRANWNAYMLTYLTPKEKLLAGQTAILIKKTDTGIKQLKAILNNNLPENTASTELYQQIGVTIAKITELINLQVNVSKDIYQQNHDRYTAAQRQFIAVMLLSLAFALPFSYFLVKNIRNLIKGLNSANQKIKAAEEKCRSFIRYAGDAIFILDEDLFIADMNDSGCKLLGYTKEELLSMTIEDIIPPEEREEHAIQLHIINELGGSLHERKVMTKGGRVVDTEINMRKLDGGGLVSIMRDITEQNKTAQIIKESEAKYRHLFENNPVCIIIWEAENLKILEVNNEVVEKYGYSKDEFKQMTLLDYRHPHDHEKMKAFAKVMQSAGVPVLNMPWTHIRKNGEEMLMEISSHQIIYDGREAVISLAIDVTERVKAQTALRKSEEKFYSLIDYAADAIFMVADDGIIFDVNRSACDILGYSKAELIGKSVLSLHLPEVRKEIPQTWAHLRKNKSFNDERKLLRKDGTPVEVQISRTMLPDASGAIAIVRDITQEKKHLQEIEDQNTRLREIAWIQSHLVRAPVASILGLTQLCDMEDSKNAEIIPKLKIAAEQLDNVIRDITKLTDNLV